MFIQDLSTAGVLALVLAYLIKLAVHAATRFGLLDPDGRKKLSNFINNSKLLGDALLFSGYLIKLVSSQ